MGIRCGDIVSGFYSFLGFTRLTSKEIIQTTVSRGVQEGVFGYFTGSIPTIDRREVPGRAEQSPL